MAVFEQPENRPYPLRAVATRTLVAWLAALVLLMVAFWLIDRSQYQHLVQMQGEREQALVDRGAGILAVELALPLADLPYLADQPAMRDWLKNGGDAPLDRIEVDFLTLARHRANFAKIRLFDARGFELVRVNRDAAGEQLVPRNALQDKAARYFVRNGLAAPAGTIHVSGLDLNVEQGVIEQPLRPMLRFGTPIVGADGQRLGLVTINYFGRHLLNRLAALAPYTHGQGLWLLDGKGNWLLGEKAEDAWAFELGGREPRFGDRYGQVWARMTGANSRDPGQALIGDELFTWRWATPASPATGWNLSGPGAEGWILVSRVSRQALAAAGADLRQLLLRWFVALAMAALAASVALTHYQVRRRQHLSQVTASEARFQKLLEAAPDAVVIVDETGRIRLVNTRVEEWFGYRAGELLGQPVEILVPEPLRARHQQHRHGYFAAPAQRNLGIGTQLGARRKDGTEFPIELALSPTTTAEGTLVIAVVRDITERHRLEQARDEAQTRYRRLFDNLPLGVFRSSMSERLADDRRFLEVNPTLVAMFEAGSTKRLLACPPARLYHDDAERAALVAELFALGSVVGRELSMVTLNGRVFDARLSIVMRRDAAGNRFVDGVIEDVSLRRAAERERDLAAAEIQRRATALEVANQELDAFSYSVSHDLRAPLRAIDGFSRILEQEYGERLDARARDHLGRVRKAAQRMAALIDDLLKLSRVTRSELKLEAVDLSALATEVLTGLQRGDPGRAVRCIVQPGIRVLGDPRLLRVVLDNLLGNAWKFTARRAEATIELGALEHNDGPVFFLRDNGVGFDIAHADKLFGAFQRLHDAREFPGTGIGLATVQRVIHKHGGHVWAEAEIDRGATFYFTLGTSITVEQAI